MRSCLFVDDEPLVLRAIGRLLRTHPIDVVLADTPRRALELCRQRAFDVVVSDFMMPQMDGAELQRQVRVILPASKRVLLTGMSDLRATFLVVCDGTVHLVMSKPFERASLVAAIDDEPRASASLA